MRISVWFFTGMVLLGTLRGESQMAPGVASAPDRSGARSGGIEILSDTQGVDFKAYLHQIHQITESEWAPLVPSEVNPPIMLSGVVSVRFKILADGKLMDKSVMLDQRSGHVSLDRAAWDAITHAVYPPLPTEFKGPYLGVRLFFSYNMEKTTGSHDDRPNPALPSSALQGQTTAQNGKP